MRHRASVRPGSFTVAASNTRAWNPPSPDTDAKPGLAAFRETATVHTVSVFKDWYRYANGASGLLAGAGLIEGEGTAGRPAPR